jgi:hypothetical protein
VGVWAHQSEDTVCLWETILSAPDFLEITHSCLARPLLLRPDAASLTRNRISK